ncbi:hypothetical protein EM868_00670 [Cupriavidus gilardii]|nr:hypothetical protein [Cupriavidus gilardii]
MSSPLMRGPSGSGSRWIPAFAGMTGWSNVFAADPHKWGRGNRFRIADAECVAVPLDEGDGNGW